MRSIVLLPLLIAFTCAQAPKEDRGAAHEPYGAIVTEPIDWKQSAGVFIGIETFPVAGAPPDVRFAADDATDLAWAFAHELPSLLAPDRTLLLLSGNPHKRISREHLLVLQHEGSVIAGGMDADAIYAHVREVAAKVGTDGVLILAIATHGYTSAGAHVLLTPDATIAQPKGVVLSRLLGAIPPKHGRRVLLFVDACRKPFGPAPARMFEELEFPGDYAIFAASAPGGYAHAHEAVQNGYFSRAVADGLAGRAKPDVEGYITPGMLDVYVSTQVRASSNGRQRPEARFGGLANLPLFRARDAGVAGTIVAPAADSRVKPQGMVAIRATLPGLHATVLVCSATTGRCWKQNAMPVAAAPTEVTRIGVQFGETDVFRVHVALTADESFLRGETRFSSVPHGRRAGRVVYWLKPITVERKEES